MDHVALIYKVLSEEATPQQKAELERWILESEENREEFEDLKLLWECSSSQDENQLADDSGFESIKLRIKEHVRRKRRIRTVLWSLFVLIIAALLVFHLRKTWLAPLERIEFRDMKMSEVINVLEARYNIEIEIGDPGILNCRYTAILLKVDDERAVLTSIEHSLNVEFIDRGSNRYKLVGDDCAPDD